MPCNAPTMSNVDLSQDCERVLLSAREIDEITTRLAREIQETYQNSPRQLVLVVILKGSMPFAADLMRSGSGGWGGLFSGIADCRSSTFPALPISRCTMGKSAV